MWDFAFSLFFERGIGNTPGVGAPVEWLRIVAPRVFKYYSGVLSGRSLPKLRRTRHRRCKAGSSASDKTCQTSSRVVITEPAVSGEGIREEETGFQAGGGLQSFWKSSDSRGTVSSCRCSA